MGDHEIVPKPDPRRKTSMSLARRATPGARPNVKAKPAPMGPAGGPLDPDVASHLRSSVGEPLEVGLRTAMEGAFSADLADVRIHRGSTAAPELGASAFTLGTDIHFAPGEFRPASSAGRHLLAHELAHVVQQAGTGPTAQASRIRPSLFVGRADDPAEREADRLADRALATSAGRHADPVTRVRRRTTGVVRRKGFGRILGTTKDSVPSLKAELEKYYPEGPSPEFGSLWSKGFLAKIENHQATGGRPTSSHARLRQVEHADDRTQNNQVRAHGWIGSLEAALRGSTAGSKFVAAKRESDKKKAAAKLLKSNKTADTPTVVPTNPSPVAVADASATTLPAATSEKSNVVVPSKPSTEVVEEAPYDGGHLVAFQFVPAEQANAFPNVAPQGRSLNNGPFSAFEKNVLVAAIDDTVKTLKSEDVGLTDAQIPDLFDYEVHVRYPGSSYEVTPLALATFGLIPPTDVEKLPAKLTLIKRIPQDWRAYAHALALPSAEEMGAKRRPETPYLGRPTSVYGAIDPNNKERTNQEYLARGPSSIVDPFTAEAVENVELIPVATNGLRSKFTRLIDWAKKEKNVALAEVVIWKPNALIGEPIELKCKSVGGKYKKGKHRVVDSDWLDKEDADRRYTPAEMTNLLTGLNNATPEPGVKLIERYLDDVTKVVMVMNAKKQEAKAVPRPSTKDTKIDFGKRTKVEPTLLPEINSFQFYAVDTQPD
jgi:hypothetical protein